MSGPERPDTTMTEYNVEVTSDDLGHRTVKVMTVKALDASAAIAYAMRCSPWSSDTASVTRVSYKEAKII